MSFQPILVIDFDGVIHSYTSPWQGVDVIPDDPVPGAFEALKEYCEHFQVMIYSSRSVNVLGRSAMKVWFKKHGWPCNDNPIIPSPNGLEFPDHKPPAFLTIDDRAILFQGIFPSAAALLEFKPWNKKK